MSTKFRRSENGKQITPIDRSSVDMLFGVRFENRGGQIVVDFLKGAKSLNLDFKIF